VDGDDGQSAVAQAARRHIVVFGFQGVGRRIVRQLTTTGRRVVVVDPYADAAQQEDLQRWGATYLAGYGDSQDTLQAADVAHAHAVLCVTDDDVRNIRLALLARDVSADVRIVVRMANSSVGTALLPVAQPGAVLDVAQLASTSFVEAAVNRTTHAITFGNEEFVIATEGCRTHGTIGSLWDGLAPVAVRATEASPTVACPDPDHHVQPGDLVTLIGTAQDYRRAGLTPSSVRAEAIGPTLRRRFRETIAAMSDAVDRPFRIAFGVLLALSAISIVVLIAAYEEPDGRHMSPLDALYFTAETIATVGFGDFYFRDQVGWLRLWAVLLILMGAALVAIATALLTNALVSRRLEQSLGRQRLTGLEDHIVVIGLGRVGSAVATGLRDAGYEVAVIDGGEGQRFVPQMRAAGIPVLIGDATLPETQRAAGIHRAAGVAVLTSDDLVNIETGLAVRGVVGERPVPIALRVFSRNLARLVGAELDAGIARSIAELASPWFVGAALGVDVLGTFYVGSTLFIAARFVVRPGGPLDGTTVREFEGRARVVALQRDGAGPSLEHPPHPESVVHPGDSVYVIGQYDDLLDLLRDA
jgi:Trk K+ transport system NAD-binding subunit